MATDDDFAVHYEPIGRLSVAFAELESQMHYLAWMALGLSVNTGSTVTETMFARDLGQLLTRIAKARRDETPTPGESWAWTSGFAAALDPVLAGKVGEIAGEFDSVAEVRNQIIHGQRFGDGLTTVRNQVRYVPRAIRAIEAGETVQAPPRTRLADIDRTTERCRDLRERASDLLGEIAESRHLSGEVDTTAE